MKFTFRRPQPGDLPALAHLIAAAEAADESAPRSPEEIRAGLEAAMADLTRTGWLVLTPARQMIGYNYIETVTWSDTLDVWLHGAVHPNWRGQGVGRALLERTWADLEDSPARFKKPGRSIFINAWAYRHDTARGHLFERFGLRPDHIYFEMSRPATHLPPLPSLPAGIEIRPWQDSDCEAAAALRNRAFAHSWGYQPTTAAALRRSFQSARYQPHLSFTARQIDRPEAEMIGLVHACQGRQVTQGELVWLAVAPHRQHQGLGQALMLTAMQALYLAGAEMITLSADHYADRPEIGLFTHLGFTVRKVGVDYRRALDVG
jgi:mycothiol synthase